MYFTEILSENMMVMTGQRNCSKLLKIMIELLITFTPFIMNEIFKNHILFEKKNPDWKQVELCGIGLELSVGVC